MLQQAATVSAVVEPSGDGAVSVDVKHASPVGTCVMVACIWLGIRLPMVWGWMVHVMWLKVVKASLVAADDRTTLPAVEQGVSVMMLC